MSVLAGTGRETIGSAEAPESTGVEQPDDSKNSNDTAHLASFVHRADQGNVRANYTYISDTNIDGKANAVVLVSAVPEPEGDASYGHNIGVWYEPGCGRSSTRTAPRYQREPPTKSSSHQAPVRLRSSEDQTLSS